VRVRFPIDDVLPEVLDALAVAPNLVLVAPPGAGKTTRVPPALLGAPWVGGGRVVMLEPRRLAARAAAGFMARLRGETVGETVGYRVRMETRVSSRTRLEVVTEGVLTRMLQHDPSLDGVAAVIFDEFHERSLHADLGLALALQTQALLRPELRIIVMSATLDTAPVAALLGNARSIRAGGRSYPVETVYLPRRNEARIEDAVAGAIRRALEQHEGDVLAFLPGRAEIGRTAERLERAGLPGGVAVLPLYGDLPQDAQDRAIAPSPPGRRKVVLATAVAETSLTIEGVRVVVDSGVMRVPRFSPRTGMTRLATVAVSRAAADQRRGRAGRLGPGFCYRLWTDAENAALLAQRPAEILEADLAPLALELAAWGVHDPAELRWLDPPPAAAYAQARELLHALDALDADGRLAAHGRALAQLALHPRLAHMLLRATSLGNAALACDLAALLAERDVLHAIDGAADPDVRLRLPLLRGARSAPHGHRIDAGAVRRAAAEARHWRNRLRIDVGKHSADESDVGLLLALAYPDRIGQRRSQGRFLLRNGRGVAMDAHHPLAREDYIVAAEVGGHGRDVKVFLAAPLQRALIEEHFAAHVVSHSEVRWDAASRSVRATTTRRLGALLLGERPLRDPPQDAVTAALLDGIRSDGMSALPWSREADRLRQRIAFLHALDPDGWPDVSDEGLLARLPDWLAPWLLRARSGDDLRRIDLGEALLTGIAGSRRASIDTLAPTHLQVPSGSRIPIDYSDPAAPVLAVRLQEVFGLTETPAIAGGRVPLTLHLLSPAHRPVQVTRDLASFWRTGYFDVRRDLRGRYPKHYWPDDPLHAEATRRTRPRG
jgi:ATP-dependent helicase HrpB